MIKNGKYYQEFQFSHCHYKLWWVAANFDRDFGMAKFFVKWTGVGSIMKIKDLHIISCGLGKLAVIYF